MSCSHPSGDASKPHQSYKWDLIQEPFCNPMLDKASSLRSWKRAVTDAPRALLGTFAISWQKNLAKKKKKGFLEIAF